MPITQKSYNEVLGQCQKIWDSIINDNGHIVYVPDGTIYADINNGDNTFTTYQINATCCNVLKKNFAPSSPTTPSFVTPNDIYFDLDEQKCRWAKGNNTSCSGTTTPIKIVLNPNGNGGSFFTLTEDDTCRLDIKFDYLFKISCETLFSTIGSTNKQADVELKVLREQKFKLETDLLSINNELSGLTKLNLNTSYSIVCTEFPSSEVVKKTSTTEITQTQKLPFNNTGFGSLTNTTDLTSTSKISPTYSTKIVNFCLTEDGLLEWKKILGVNNYAGFIDGDPNSYTCDHVIKIDELNTNNIINNGPILILECATPFGEKTSIIKKTLELSKKQESLTSEILIIDEKISGLVNDSKSSCDTMVGQFENLKARVSIDYVDDNGNTQPFWFESLFPIPQITDLYSHIKNTGINSGFLVCGEPNTSELSWTTGCTPLIYSEFTNGQLPETEIPEHLNVGICESVKDNLYDELYAQYQTSVNNAGSTIGFEASLNPNVFNSDWLRYEKSITGVTTITNKKIILNVEITSSCGNFCLLVDQINLTKVCTDADRNDIFISESPGFNLTRIIDNKKSWLEAEEPTNRDFFIGDVNDNNKIRQTEYSIDDERLVINTKEIDLTMNMASAVENDVWCYLLDNPNLLTGTTCSSTSAFTPTDIYGNPITLPTAQTYTYNVVDLVKSAESFYLLCSYGRVVMVRDTCFPELECSLCGTALKIETGKGNESLWVTCDEVRGLGAYHITDDTDAESTIYNITYSLTGNALTNLTNFITYLNTKLTQGEVPYEVFWDSSGNCYSCCKNCGDDSINFTGFMTTNITEVNTLETFENLMVSELTDAKNRKILSAYPTLRAVYDRYMNATKYGVPQSNEFTYDKMDKFAGLIKSYWDDLIEQVVPATTMWGSIKVYTNTMFDQQKFKYRSYTSLFCNSPLNFVAPPSPINGSEGQCENVEVVTTYIDVFPDDVRRRRQVTYNKICLTQMNFGSEFVGNVDIQDGNGNFINNDTFCDNVCRKAVWYDMVESPEIMMNLVTCGLYLPTYTSTTFSAQSFVINGNELINTTFVSDEINDQNIIWVPAQNDIISGCTLSNPTGFTYTNFVDFLNNMFYSIGLGTQYEARLSYKEIEYSTLADGTITNNPPKSKNGFYLIFPENDTFELTIGCESQNGTLFIYKNDNLLFGPNDGLQQTYSGSWGINTNVNYDCLKNVINE